MVNKPKVLALSYLFPNTAYPNHGIFVFNRLNALSQYADIKVINPIPWSPVHPYLAQYRSLSSVPLQCQLGNLDVYHPRFFSIPRVLKAFEVATYKTAVLKTVRQQLAGFDFELIDLHWTFPDLPAGFMLSRSYHKPYLVTLRGMEAFHFQDSGSRSRIVAKYLKQANHVIALSEELKQASIKLGVESRKHSVVRNGVDTNQFHFIRQSEAREKLRLEPSEKLIVMVGSLIRRKGFDLVISALPEICRVIKQPLKLYIVGSEGPEGDYRNQLYQLVRLHGLEDNVIFKGAVNNNQLVYWYNAADVFCLASRGEGSPNVLTEAIACGCPSVATDVGAVREIIESEADIGTCVASENTAAIAEAIGQLILAVPDRRLNAKKFGCYDWNWCAGQAFQAYDALLTDSEKNET